MALLSKENETKILIGALLVAGLVAYKINSVKGDIKDVVVKDLNPASDDNIVNKGVSKVVAAATGNKHKSLGSYTFCLFNSDAIVCNPELLESAHRNNVSFYAEDKDGNKVINPQLTQLWTQEKDFFEEDLL